jgi:galactokinase
VQEIARVEQACQSLLADDRLGFGRLMLDSHASLRDLYEVSLPELDGLVRIAMGIEGCYGARLTGAGFGGCTVNLVAGHKAWIFTQMLKEQYQQEFGRQANVYLCRAARGAHVVGD